MIDYEILQDIITDHELCKTQENELAKVVELLKADRLIELPCKVGDTVYFPTQDRHDEATVNSISIGEEGILVHWVQYERGVDIIELWDEDFFEISEIGKTVFLTKEEAEAKLAELKGTEE